MAPIRKGDGTGLTPKGFSEVRKGDGTVLYSAGPAIPDSGVSRWRFEDSPTDSWNGYSLSLTGATYTTTHYEGSYALNVDGSDDYATTGNTISEIDGSSELSISVWVNVDSFASSGNPAYVAQGDNWDNHIAILHSPSSSDIQARVENGATLAMPSFPTSDMGAGNWYMITLTYDGSDVYIYLDDVQKDSQSAPSTSPTVSNALEIGRNGWSGHYTDSKIDDVRVYDKALSSNEVSNLYNTGSI